MSGERVHWCRPLAGGSCGPRCVVVVNKVVEEPLGFCLLNQRPLGSSPGRRHFRLGPLRVGHQSLGECYGSPA
jgi:hypothetical protein